MKKIARYTCFNMIALLLAPVFMFLNQRFREYLHVNFHPSYLLLGVSAVVLITLGALLPLQTKSLQGLPRKTACFITALFAAIWLGFAIFLLYAFKDFSSLPLHVVIVGYHLGEIFNVAANRK